MFGHLAHLPPKNPPIEQSMSLDPIFHMFFPLPGGLAWHFPDFSRHLNNCFLGFQLVGRLPLAAAV